MKQMSKSVNKQPFTVNSLTKELFDSFLYKDVALTTIIKQGIYLSNLKTYDGVDVNIIRPEANKLNIDVRIMQNIINNFKSQPTNEMKYKYLKSIFQGVWNNKK